MSQEVRILPDGTLWYYEKHSTIIYGSGYHGRSRGYTADHILMLLAERYDSLRSERFGNLDQYEGMSYAQYINRVTRMRSSFIYYDDDALIKGLKPESMTGAFESLSMDYVDIEDLFSQRNQDAIDLICYVSRKYNYSMLIDQAHDIMNALNKRKLFKLLDIGECKNRPKTLKEYLILKRILAGSKKHWNKKMNKLGVKR